MKPIFWRKKVLICFFPQKESDYSSTELSSDTEIDDDDNTIGLTFEPLPSDPKPDYQSGTPALAPSSDDVKPDFENLQTNIHHLAFVSSDSKSVNSKYI